eukprot:CAMPEP_0196204074 /NCGR_PEP_ID=MMETSP0912-20130531/6324_1 /TAXON_ID=49265 /ORGANISM="Thalassiosira rotula, Strain GSO102" /LENGTH=85 /DNA_ID=CAMNT_0041478283 /DNA_START=492 /DNA_END=749 /DNA_ORIENTATION=-
MTNGCNLLNLLATFLMFQQGIDIRPQNIPRHGPNQRSLHIPLLTKQRQMRNGIHPKQLNHRPTTPNIRIHHDEVHSIPVLLLHRL